MRSLRPALALILRLFLGAVFLYAAVGKWGAPRAFAEDVANYRLLPAGLVPVLTVSILGIETLLGAVLIAGVLRLEAALLTAGVMALFTAAVGSAILRDLKIECGCFGAGGSPATTATLLRDLGFLLAAGVLAWLSARPGAGAPAAGDAAGPLDTRRIQSDR